MSTLHAIAAVLLGSTVALAQSHKSGPVQIDPTNEHVWATNSDHASISRVRTADHVVDQFDLPGEGRPRGLAITGDEVWVADEAADSVHVLDAATGAVIHTVDMEHGAAPVSVAISPDGDTALIALHRAHAIAVVDVPTHTLTGIIQLNQHRPFGIAFTSDDEAWITHSIMDGEDGYVSSINAATLSVTSTVILKSVNPKDPSQIAGDPDPIPEGGYLLVRGHPAPLADTLWLPVQYQNFHNSNFTPDSTVQAAIHRIDLNTRLHLGAGDRLVLTGVYAHDNTTLIGDGWDAQFAGPIDIAFIDDTAYLVGAYSNDVLVFPTDTQSVKPQNVDPLTEIPVGDHPIGIAAHANTLYVLNALSRDLSVIDATSLQEIARVPLTPGTPDPVDPQILTGAILFNSSADPRLSSNAKVSCASCHIDGGGDGLLWQFAAIGAGSRKTLDLRGLALSFAAQVDGHGQLHRSGDRDEVQDFELTAQSQIMGGTGFINEHPPLGRPNAGLDPDLDAIAAYLLSLAPVERSPHRDADQLSAAAVRGAAIYKQTEGPLAIGCVDCHTPPTYTDLDFHDISGHAPPPENEGPPFNTPTLVGLWDAGPHVQAVGWADGQSLGGVLRAATGAHGDTTGLTRRQRLDVESFLLSLDGDLVESGIDAILDLDAPRITAVRPVSLSQVEVIFDEFLDAATAENPANYVFDNAFTAIAATDATLDALEGNRVRVTVPLTYAGCDVTYTLIPGPIEDVASLAGSPSNNVLDVDDPSNQHSFTIDGTITVTFGDQGDETFPGVARDAGFVAGLGNVSHARWWLYPQASPEMKGFIRFDFTDALINDCNVTDAADILEAGFTHTPFIGHVNTIEARRCLMPWNDPPRDWCFNCTGSPTRNHASHNTIPWHQQGAAKLAGDGDDPAEYYPQGSADLASTVDAIGVVESLDRRVAFAGPLVTDAFRFWFDNPAINFGYAVNVAGDTRPTEFWGSNQEDGRYASVLTITYAVQPNAGRCDCPADVNGDGALDVLDFVAFQVAWQAQDPAADCDASGDFDVLDFVCFQGLFIEGCD